MADASPESDFECPNCHGLVEPEWHACPTCGVEFDPPETEAPAAPAADVPAAAPPPAVYDELSASVGPPTGGPSQKEEIIIRDLAAPVPAPAGDDPLAKLEKEISGELGKISSTAEHLLDLEREIKNELGKIRSISAPTVIVPVNLAQPAAPALPAAASASAKRWGLVSLMGAGLSLLGVVGVLIATNWDTLILGASQNTIGATQLIGINGTAVLAAMGLVVIIVGAMRQRHKPQRAL